MSLVAPTDGAKSAKSDGINERSNMLRKERKDRRSAYSSRKTRSGVIYT
jgi:hypothetical protein